MPGPGTVGSGRGEPSIYLFSQAALEIPNEYYGVKGLFLSKSVCCLYSPGAGTPPE